MLYLQAMRCFHPENVISNGDFVGAGLVRACAMPQVGDK